MKKLTIISAALVAGLSFATPSQAQTVGVQFNPYYSSPYSTLNGSKYTGPQNISAGVVAQGNWNVANGGTGGGDGQVTGDITNDNLISWVPNTNPGPYPNNGPYTYAAGASTVDSTGAASSVIFDLSGATTQRGNNNQTSFAGGTGDSELSGGGAFNYGGSVSLELAGLNNTDSYTLIGYLNFDYYATVQYGQTPPYSVIEASLGSSHFYIDSQPQSTLTSWTQATGTTAGTATLANYVEFTVSGAVLNSDSLIIDNGGGLSGFQLIDNGSPSVPEPSTVWLFALGVAGLVFQIQRKRLAKS